jgi:hypothetical protein
MFCSNSWACGLNERKGIPLGEILFVLQDRKNSASLRVAEFAVKPGHFKEESARSDTYIPWICFASCTRSFGLPLPKGLRSRSIIIKSLLPSRVLLNDGVQDCPPILHLKP